MESQRSHVVVAPMVTWYSQLGHSVEVSNWYASSSWPVWVSAGSTNGVPAKPVLTLPPDSRTKQARRLPALTLRTGSPSSRPKAMASA